MMNTHSKTARSTWISCCIALLAACVLAGNAGAQSLYITENSPQVEGPNVQTGPSVLLEDVSLIYIPEPEIRTYQKHDIITIIIDETSSQTSSQTLETTKESEGTVRVNAMVDLLQLLELRVGPGRLNNETIFDASAEREFTGEGDYARQDRFNAQITATVVEVKPNGSLVLQANKRIAKDEEIQMLVIAGMARSEDITRQNTILSSQLANLTLSVQNEGDVKKAAEKGIITEFFDLLFAF
ncbi:MAG: flagellar basal body L-ring protein FlgH [Phycisphaerales bacterium]